MSKKEELYNQFTLSEKAGCEISCHNLYISLLFKDVLQVPHPVSALAPSHTKHLSLYSVLHFELHDFP